MIRPETLLYLDEISKTLSITKAAENLYLSKSSLSAAIKNLEEELGVSVLVRTSYGVELTPAGEMIVKKSKVILELLNQIKEECWIYKEHENVEEITCLMSAGFADNIFPSLIRSFRQVSGKARIITAQANLEDIIQQVQSNKYCLGFYVSHEEEMANIYQNKNVIINEINSYKLYAVTSKYSRYIADDIKDITMEELYKYPLIKCDYDDAQTYWGEYKEDKAYVFSTDNMNIYNQAISDDIGIGLMSGIALQQNNLQKNILRKICVKDAPETKLYLISNVNCPNEIRVKYEDVLIKIENE